MNDQPEAAIFRKAINSDIAHIWEIINAQKGIMAAEGRTQWQNGYPSPETIATDVAKGVGRVLCDKLSGRVMAYCALIYSGDPAYDFIKDGEWMTPQGSRYAAVHRLAVSPYECCKGLAKRMFGHAADEAIANGCKSIRVDTNHDNVQMLHILPTLNYQRCGIVRQSDGDRIAFELILS